MRLMWSSVDKRQQNYPCAQTVRTQWHNTHLPHSFSSLLSPQWSVPSHFSEPSMHLLLSQVNWAGEQVRGATKHTQQQQSQSINPAECPPEQQKATLPAAVPLRANPIQPPHTHIHTHTHTHSYTPTPHTHTHTPVRTHTTQHVPHAHARLHTNPSCTHARTRTHTPLSHIL